MRARNLDRIALEQIHVQHYPAVYRYVRFRIEDEEICAHLSEKVFSLFLESVQQKRHPKRDMLVWFMDTASRLVEDYLSKRPNPRTESLMNHISQGAIPGDENVQPSQKLQFQKALQALPADEQHFLALRFSQNLALGQLSDLIGKKVHAVRLLQWRALNSLYNAFTGSPPHE